MVKIYYVDEPEKKLTLDDIKKIGILYWKIDADNFEKEGVLAKIRKERGYNYNDIVTCAPSTLPNYSDKMKSFFKEHLHLDEEIRFFLDGSGYFDARTKDEKWIRMHCEKGDLIVLPAGIYHRYKNDEKDFAKVMRLFCGEPVWTPYDRSTESDAMAERKHYEKFLKDGTPPPKVPRGLTKVFVKSPDVFDATLERYKNAPEVYIYVNSEKTNGKGWCPDCERAEPILMEHLEKTKAVLLECPCIRADYKGNPEFPYRTHKLLQVKSIPTLIKYNKDGDSKRIVDPDCSDAKAVAAFFA